MLTQTWYYVWHSPQAFWWSLVNSFTTHTSPNRFTPSSVSTGVGSPEGTTVHLPCLHVSQKPMGLSSRRWTAWGLAIPGTVGQGRCVLRSPIPLLCSTCPCFHAPSWHTPCLSPLSWADVISSLLSCTRVSFLWHCFWQCISAFFLVCLWLLLEMLLRFESFYIQYLRSVTTN